MEAVVDAYFDCRRHKRNTLNQLAFEAHLERNLMQLWRDLRNGDYRIGPSIAFVVTHPKVREVWAADFRDRIVHHVIYNAIRERFTARFIRDSYGCIPDRGTLDGARRIAGFARSVTRNWTQPAFVLKADIANFFTSICHDVLLDQLDHLVHEEWIRRLIRQVVRHDARPSAQRRSGQALFDQVPPHKSLWRAPEGFGLPIGNLTSQFFANVYLNSLDQFAKHALKARHYGRYVDDVVMIHTNADALRDRYQRMDRHLKKQLRLHWHPDKTKIDPAHNGIDFVGFVIKPGRLYLRRTTLANCRRKIRSWERDGSTVERKRLSALAQSVTSYLGMLRSVNGFNARRDLCQPFQGLFIHPDHDYTKLIVP